MCLAYPARVITLRADGTADVVVRGRPQRLLLTVLAGDGVPVAVGDWLLAQSGLAVARIDAAEAADRTRLLDHLTHSGGDQFGGGDHDAG